MEMLLTTSSWLNIKDHYAQKKILLCGTVLLLGISIFVMVSIFVKTDSFQMLFVMGMLLAMPILTLYRFYKLSQEYTTYHQ